MNQKTLFLLIATMLVGAACRQEAATSTAPDTAPQPAQQVAKEAPAATVLLPNLREPVDGVISGGQPSPEQLAAARDAGYKTVINLRLADETGVGNESELVDELGMAYVSIPVRGSAGLTRENTEAFAKALETAEYPVVLHCGSGNRIGALFALKAFWIDGKSSDEALQIGVDSGLTRLEGAVKELLEAESGAS